MDLLGRGLGIFAELNFGDGHEPGERHADRAADDPLFVEAGVEHSGYAELLLQAESHRMDAAFRTDVLAEHQHARVRFELLVENPADSSSAAILGTARPTKCNSCTTRAG